MPAHNIWTAHVHDVQLQSVSRAHSIAMRVATASHTTGRDAR